MITFLIGIGVGYLIHVLVSAQELTHEWRKIRAAWRRIRNHNLSVKHKLIVEVRNDYTSMSVKPDTPF